MAEHIHLSMPSEYLRNVLRKQLCLLLAEDMLKDTTITLRESSLKMSSFALSLLSPVLRLTICGKFMESFSRRINLEDVDERRFLKLVQLALGEEDLTVDDMEELLELGELAERLQMEAVREHAESLLLKELREDNCVEMFQRSEASGLEYLRKECYRMLRDQFEVVSQREDFGALSEETMESLLEDDELGSGWEEEILEALVRWIERSRERVRGERLLRQIRYGVVGSEYLARDMSSKVSGHEILKVLLEEAMAKKGSATVAGEWDGVERLCEKWMVARKVKGNILGADILRDVRCVAVDSQGRIVVSDSVLNQVLFFNRDASVALRLGSFGQGDGEFNEPVGVAIGPQGHIFVADRSNHRIQVLNTDGSVVRCFGCKGTAVGALAFPRGLVIDSHGNIIVADNDNHRIQVFDAEGHAVRHFGREGAAVGHFKYPMDVAIDGAGRIVVADTFNHRVQVLNADGSVALCFGSQGYTPGCLMYPYGVAVDKKGRFVVADTGNDRVQVFNGDGSVVRVVGGAGGGEGELRSPVGVAVDAAGRIVVVEGSGPRGNNHRLQIF